MTQLIVLLATQVVISVALIVWTRARVRGFLASNEELDRIRREIGALVIELDASADRNVTVLEDRLSALKDLVMEADKRIAILGQERGRRPQDPAVYDRQGRLSDARQAAQPQDQAQAHTQPARQPPQLPERREQPADPAVPFIRFSDKPLPVEEPFADKVVSLYRRGFSSDIIAARLGVTMAEVDLVISLERERGGQAKE